MLFFLLGMQDSKVHTILKCSQRYSPSSVPFDKRRLWQRILNFPENICSTKQAPIPLNLKIPKFLAVPFTPTITQRLIVSDICHLKDCCPTCLWKSLFRWGKKHLFLSILHHLQVQIWIFRDYQIKRYHLSPGSALVYWRTDCIPCP